MDCRAADFDAGSRLDMELVQEQRAADNAAGADCGAGAGDRLRADLEVRLSLQGDNQKIRKAGYKRARAGFCLSVLVTERPQVARPVYVVAQRDFVAGGTT